ncbi:MAG: CDP-diacylglycerol--glycerol-3-phosphate 3-phosphatidyltransferase [Victivallales bacterium]|nr:CDP-diacylglycerol--glycerol-3-phosphate 3-phosphatidyltransferase [Victivallales bacterium]
MNFPNALTLARIFLIFVFIILAANADGIAKNFNSAQILRIIAYAIALVAAFTDLADGYFARKWNQVTDFGKLMDPLADKIFISGIMLMMVQYKLLPAWVAVVIISREFLVTGLRMLAAQKQTVIAADIWGKIKTVLQMLMMGVGGLAWVGLFDIHGTTVGGISIWTTWTICLYFISAVTVWSGLGYFFKYKKLYINSMR